MAGLALGVFFGALTAYGAFIACLILCFIYHSFDGSGLSRVAKFVTFMIFGVLFAGLGGVFFPFALGLIVAWGVGNDPSTPSELDAVFYIGYFGIIMLCAVFGVRSILSDGRNRE